MTDDYCEIHPAAGEGAIDYARRLETDGRDEMFIRKALVHHFGMPNQALPDFFEDFELARLRHVALVAGLRAYPSERAFIRKVRANLGISAENATALVERFKACGLPSQGDDKT